MLLRVNKNTGSRRQPVKYAALSSGTISNGAVWYDDETSAIGAQKRQNHIHLKREKPAAPKYDA